MALCFTIDAPPAVRWFVRLLFFRAPLPEEVPQVEAALRLLRQRWAWVAAGYLAYVGLLVVPGLLRDKGAAYAVTSVLLPHLALYLLLMMTAYSWVGFRINLSNLREFLAAYKRKTFTRTTLAGAAVAFIGGGIVGYLGGMTGSAMSLPIAEWLRDTFTPGVILLLFIVLISAVPELVAQLRMRQHELIQDLLAARTAQEQLARATAESELRLLQAQVEPHFLYNTLANLRYLVQTGSADALRMTDALIEYLRTSVPDMRAQHVTLGREADHARHYLEIMQMRMAGRLSYAIDVPAELRDLPLPPLVLLTLVENAVKHGIGPRIEGGRIELRAFRQGEGVGVEVADDGVGLESESRSGLPSTGAGLRNVAGRLKLVYGDDAQLELAPNAPRGTRALLRLPTAPPVQPKSAEIQVVLMTEEEAAAQALPALATGAAHSIPHSPRSP